ncbi:hypothetical protein [Salidesulfovibrio onnuriiensis]|uniref:hypothetical protein n=1 Tax=Salidesulfovibrio onnuriiensis TaxID=2583823 RepID=UPI0011CB54FA|nr:hypothetical protein [Salidesulfovibrio onnuriiensis]
MKKLMLALAMVVMLSSVAAAQECFNAKGSAVVTGIVSYYADNQWRDFNSFWVTNISSSAVTCRVRVFDQDGMDVTNFCSVSTGSSGKKFKTIATGTGTFELPAGATRMVHFIATNHAIMGHAIIDWTSEDNNLRKALISTFRMYKTEANRGFMSTTPVNNGQPF